MIIMIGHKPIIKQPALGRVVELAVLRSQRAELYFWARAGLTLLYGSTRSLVVCNDRGPPVKLTFCRVEGRPTATVHHSPHSPA